MSKSKGHRRRGWLRQTFFFGKNLAPMKLSGCLVYAYHCFHFLGKYTQKKTRIKHHYTHNTVPKSALAMPKVHMCCAVHTYYKKISDILSSFAF